MEPSGRSRADRSYLDTVRYTADIVVINPDQQVLLIERGWDPFKGYWALPGGHVDSGETFQQAAVRELEEETGVRVAAEDLHLTRMWDAPDRDPRGWYVTAAYRVEVPTSIPIEAGDDARTAQWWPLDDLPPLAFDHADILAAAVRSTS